MIASWHIIGIREQNATRRDPADPSGFACSTLCIRFLLTVGGMGVAVGGTGVAVGGMGVEVGGTEVAVGGTLVAVGGTGVAVGDAPPLEVPLVGELVVVAAQGPPSGRRYQETS